MTDIMKLADTYARLNAQTTALGAGDARAALQSAIEALQKEVSTLDVLLEECKMDWSGDVTQLKAEHKHEIEALQSQLDAMGKGEPVGFVAPHDLKTLREGYPATVVMLPSNKRTEPLFAAPKALSPLSRDDVKRICAEADYTHESAQSKADFINGIRHGEKAHGIGGTP